MYLILVTVGVLVTLAGAAMIGLGVPNSGGDINTTIIAGTTAFVGGLILIGLSEAVRQLRRIAESLMIRPVGRMPRANDALAPAAPAAADMPPAAPRIPFPPKTEPRHRAPSIDTGADHFDRPPAFARRAPEPRIVPERDEMHEETPEETPLSPAAPFSAAREEKDELSEGLLATAFSRLDVSMRPVPPAEPSKQPNQMFDSLWPPERKAAQPAEAAALEPEPPMAEHPAPVEEQPEPSEPPYAVSILKSGVVDGMAYTLYSDGSIEAEMPQGTVRFASIVELRAYLEKSPS